MQYQACYEGVYFCNGCKQSRMTGCPNLGVTIVAKDVGHPEHLKLAKQIARKEIPAA